jgi:phosphoribosylformylglycinamidine cyclo-ligase
MYVPLVAALHEHGLPVHYLSHITGHGLLKLMRPPGSFTYRISHLPEVPEVLTFMVEQAKLDPHGAYSTFNMGCGFAVYCAAGSGQSVVALAQQLGLKANMAGVVERGARSVILEPVGVRYQSSELELSAQGHS